jgi:hypothetical protein
VLGCDKGERILLEELMDDTKLDVLLLVSKVCWVSPQLGLRGDNVMRKLILPLVAMQLLYVSETAFAQSWTWSPPKTITETTAQDHHSTFAGVGPASLFRATSTTTLAFARTDSVGSNICIMTVDRNGWSSDVQHITSGPGINEYPSLASGERKAVVVYQAKQASAHNIFSSTLDSSGWSSTLAITEDTDQDNLYPNVTPLGGDRFAIVWEKSGKIYLREYDGLTWFPAVQLTPHDSLYNTKPVVFGPSGSPNITVVWERSKYSAPSEHDLFYAVRKDDLWMTDTLTTVGDNRNPRFVNGGTGEITWQRRSGVRWEICGARNLDNPYSKPELGVVSSDSLLDYTQCSGVSFLLPTAGFRRGTLSGPIIRPFIVGAWQQQKVSSQDFDIVLSNYVVPDQALFLVGTQTNPSTGVFTEGNGYRVWVVWESDQTGAWNLFGTTEYIPITMVESRRTEASFALYQNYPNPFNPTTVIRYEIKNGGIVVLSIHDLLGREVQRLAFNRQHPGVYEVLWDGRDGVGRNVASGVYIYSLTVVDDQSRGYRETRKMLLIR